MIEKLPYNGEPDSVKIGRVSGLTTIVLGETASITAALETHSAGVFAIGTIATMGASMLAAIGIPKIFSRPEPQQ